MSRRAWFAWNCIQSCSLFYPLNKIKNEKDVNTNDFLYDLMLNIFDTEQKLYE